jgi:hypothetical protein
MRSTATQCAPWLNWANIERLLGAEHQPAASLGLQRSAPPSVRQAWAEIEIMIRVVANGGIRSCGPANSTYPWLDRRLVEFMARLPFEQKAGPLTNRRLHRKSLGSILPPSILSRRAKASGDEPICRALRRERAMLKRLCGEDSLLAGLGFVEPSKLRETLDRACGGAVAELMYVGRAMAVEGWFRHCAESATVSAS